MAKLLNKTKTIFALIAFISFSALAIALASEAFLGLEPCKLCIYQRWPFVFGFLIGIIGILTQPKRFWMAVCSVNFLVNSGIALYHSGVERRWWISQVDGCSVHFANQGGTMGVLENLMSTPMGSCEDIPWQDPFIGFSMANYNVILCFALAVLCALATVYGRQSSSVSSVSQ